jgi:hypothetical protein
MLGGFKLRGSWRKIRSKIGIRSERMAIKSHQPWYVKVGLHALTMGIAGAIAWVVVDNSYRITGFNRDEARTQIASITAENTKLKQSYEAAKSQLNERDGQLSIEKAAQAELAKNVGQLQEETASLREDLGFLRNVMSTGSIPDGLAIQNFKVERDALPNEFRYRLLLTQGGQRRQEFKGKIQLIARIQAAGTSTQAQQTTLSIPPDAELKSAQSQIEFRFYQKIDGRFRIPEGAVLKGVQVRVFGLPGFDVRGQKNITF